MNRLNRIILLIACCLLGFSFRSGLLRSFAQDESTVDSVVANEPVVQADDSVVDAGSEEIADADDSDDAANVQNEGEEESDSEEGADKKKEGEEDKPQEPSKNLYERRGRLPPVPRN
jgi:hypothetical protein